MISFEQDTYPIGAFAGYDVTLLADPTEAVDLLHKKLEEKYGARLTSAYLWTRHADGRIVCRMPYALAGSEPVEKVSLNEKLMIRARVNITKKNSDGKRRAWSLHDKKPRREWLERRGLEHGFRVGPMAIIVHKEQIAHKGKSFWIDATEFTGWVTISDPEKFNEVLVKGLSARRAWGFGLVELIERHPG